MDARTSLQRKLVVCEVGTRRVAHATAALHARAACCQTARCIQAGCASCDRFVSVTALRGRSGRSCATRATVTHSRPVSPDVARGALSWPNPDTRGLATTAARARPRDACLSNTAGRRRTKLRAAAPCNAVRTISAPQIAAPLAAGPDARRGRARPRVPLNVSIKTGAPASAAPAPACSAPAGGPTHTQTAARAYIKYGRASVPRRLQLRVHGPAKGVDVRRRRDAQAAARAEAVAAAHAARARGGRVARVCVVARWRARPPPRRAAL